MMIKKILIASLILYSNSIFAAEIKQQLCSNLVNSISINSKAIRAHTACTIEQLKRGLMNIKQLPENSGMLFVFNEEQYLSFWAKDTYIPIDIAFLNENMEILEINSLKPLDLSTIRSNAPASYALEVNAGWFSKNRIKVGDKVILTR